MSKPSARKLQKQKARERRVAKKRHEANERQRYARNFPAFEFRLNNSPPGFVDLIRRTLRDIEFWDRSLFRPEEIDFLKLIKRKPEIVTPVLHHAVANRNLTALHYATMIGHRVFTRIPIDQLRQWIPFHDVQFNMAGERIIVVFRSLEQIKGTSGTVYYSPKRPTVEINGKRFIVGWSRHAIERTCERLAPRWDSYLGLGDVFAFFHQCRRFDSCNLHSGRQIGFTFYDQCAEGYFSGHIAKQVLGRAGEGKCYYRVGYCPVVIEGHFAKATTLLYPGFAGTPEYGLILRHGMGRKSRTELIDLASRMTRDELEKTQDFSLLRMFHDNGVAQIIESHEEFYSII